MSAAATRRSTLVALIALPWLMPVFACTQSANGKESAPMTADPTTGGAKGPSPTAQTLTLSASITGTQLRLTLENKGTTDLKVNSHVKAGSRIDLDWFSVTVRAGGAARELRFSGPRDRAGRIQETLAPGKSLHHDVDLAWWAQQTVNGGRPLPTGKATLVAAYEVTGEPGVWNGRIEAPAIDVSW